jgi:hypothetical protein
MDLVVQSPDELLAAVPHVLGFKLFWTMDRVADGAVRQPVAE